MRIKAMNYDVVIIGAGAAGLMCAVTAAQRGRRVLVIDHAAKIAQKIRISGGGRCNFTNIHTSKANFISRNPHFAISALSRYTQRDIIALVDRHGIRWHEKTLGQLFCNESSQQIIDMLVGMGRASGVEILADCTVRKVEQIGDNFTIHTAKGHFFASSLVIATGGLSIPKMGATGFGYDIARQFGLEVITPEPALVPFVFGGDARTQAPEMAGVSIHAARTIIGKTVFDEAVLYTHKGLSGPAILQISSYWRPGQKVRINLAPDQDLAAMIRQAKQDHPRMEPTNFISQLLPKRLASSLCQDLSVARMADLSNAHLNTLVQSIQAWDLVPAGTEGFAKAEVTRGGVNTDNLSSQTMMAKTVPGLYFIGEVVDVTGHLGGFNFQWAWASGHAAGMAA